MYLIEIQVKSVVLYRTVNDVKLGSNTQKDIYGAFILKRGTYPKKQALLQIQKIAVNSHVFSGTPSRIELEIEKTCHPI